MDELQRIFYSGHFREQITMERNSRLEWIDGFHFEGYSHSGKKIRLDSWKDRENEEAGPTPAELIFHVKGEDLDPEKIEHAVALSRDKYCLISNTLKKVADITHYYTINGGEPVKVPLAAQHR